MPRHEYVLTLPHHACPNPTPPGATIVAATDADREVLITEGNLPSEIIFSRAGFQVVPEETP
jgi:hypothetical protein